MHFLTYRQSTFYCPMLPELATINHWPHRQQIQNERRKRDTNSQQTNDGFPFIDRQQYISCHSNLKPFVV